MRDLISKSALIKTIRLHANKINSLYEDEETVVQIIEKQPTYVPDTNIGENVEFCEWKLDGIYLHCQHKLDLIITCLADEKYRYNFCPYCGKKITILNYPFDPEE